MRKLRIHNNLRSLHAPATGRSAFSLAELIISVGILVLLMSLAGQIFNFTVQSTGQATALTKINQTIRMMERTIREDLAQVQAGHSILIIQGNPVNAYRTADGKDADNDGDPFNGYDTPSDPDREDATGLPLSPRADVLMFVTARPGQSFVTPTMTASNLKSVALSSQLQLVTYGIAELGDYTFDPDTSTPGNPVYDFDFQYGTSELETPNAPVVPTTGTPPYPSTTRVSQFAASQWHLYRRPTLLLPTAYADLVAAFASDTAAQNNLMPPTLDATNLAKLVLGSSDAMAGVSLEEDILRPDVLPFVATDISQKAPWYLPPFLTNNTTATDGLMLISPSRIDVEPPPQLATRMGHYFMPNCASFKVEWALDPQSEFVGGRLDGINETLWFDPGDNGDPLVANSNPDPLRSAALMIQDLNQRISSLSSDKGKQLFLRQRRTNLISLIEETWDDRSIEGYCGQIGYSLQDRFRGPSAAHTDPNNDPTCGWRHPFINGIQRPNMHVFTATRPKLQENPPGSLNYDWDGESVVPDPMFPGALRITIDLYDKDGRLERPIRHVMIIPIGG